MNHLINEKSPYLLQHRENPVDWYPWSSEAFETAARENKPVFLSIGYSTCHWCHVMADESFQDSEISKLMNETFVNIKVDREERPDLDQIYMNVCQMLNGSGGWPLNVIMTPDQKPFFAATYVPKRGKYGRIGMIELIDLVRKLWRSDSREYLQTAEQIIAELREPGNGEVAGEKSSKIPAGIVRLATESFRHNYDEVYGGFGVKPKFPSGHNLMFLLRYYYRHPDDHEVLEMAEKTLTEMRKGGIFDQIGYGFHRYSTDERWFLPHFEKMLFDQAILGLAYSCAWQITRKGIYKTTTENILDYVIREMTDREGGFFSAQDADSEDEEGKFYVWEYNEIKNSLTEQEWNLFCETYNIRPDGNFKDESVYRKVDMNIISMVKDVDMRFQDPDWTSKILNLNNKLYQVREKRVHPLTDDKILTNWNGLMISAMSAGAGITGNHKYLDAAIQSAEFVWNKLLNHDIAFHRFRENETGIDANLEDYAFYTWGILKLYQAGGDISWLKRATELIHKMIDNFYDSDRGGFFFSSKDSFLKEKLIVRSKDYYDGAMPCGNSMAFYDLVLVYRLTGNSEWMDAIEKCIQNYNFYIMSFPAGLTMFLQAIDIYQSPGTEIVINGNPEDEQIKTALRYLRENYLPDVFCHKRNSKNYKELAQISPFTESMGDPEKTAFYVCQNYACRQPVYSVDEFLEMIRGGD